VSTSKCSQSFVVIDFCFHFAELLNFLDPSIDPCENFYEYTCGGWKRKNPLPNQKEEWNQFTKMEEESNQFIRKILKSKETQAEYSKVSSTDKICRTLIFALSLVLTYDQLQDRHIDDVIDSFWFVNNIKQIY